MSNDAGTIVAVATPPGQGGVGLIRLSGPRAIAIGRQIVRCSPPLGARVRRVELGEVLVHGFPVDTVLAWVFEAPRSFTGDDTVEISCHGSSSVLQAVVAEAVRLGAVGARPGEFTRRAFLNGKIDLVQAESVVDLVRAEGLHGVRSAYGGASGRLSGALRQLAGDTVGIAARLEALLDFPEEDDVRVDLDAVAARCAAAALGARSLCETFEGARLRQAGALVAIVGAPNVGKSTLLNALLGEERAIVAPDPGTTRDGVEGRTVWGGLVVRLIDTAGLRNAQDAAEAEGVRRARALAAQADVVLVVVDGSVEWGGDELGAVGDVSRERAVLVLNKEDLGLRKHRDEGGARGMRAVSVSALSGRGLGELVEVACGLLPAVNAADGVAIVRERHREGLERIAALLAQAGEALGRGEPAECAAATVRAAAETFSDLLGERPEEELLDRIFSEFCVGK